MMGGRAEGRRGEGVGGMLAGAKPGAVMLRVAEKCAQERVKSPVELERVSSGWLSQVVWMEAPGMARPVWSVMRPVRVGVGV